MKKSTVVQTLFEHNGLLKCTTLLSEICLTTILLPKPADAHLQLYSIQKVKMCQFDFGLIQESIKCYCLCMIRAGV